MGHGQICANGGYGLNRERISQFYILKSSLQSLCSRNQVGALAWYLSLTSTSTFLLFRTTPLIVALLHDWAGKQIAVLTLTLVSLFFCKMLFI
jgi:hypothetical protein